MPGSDDCWANGWRTLRERQPPMAKLLTTALSTQIVRFKPGGPPQQFDVAVQNHSPNFATLQLELLASGVNPTTTEAWYSLAPDLSAMIPTGDRTHFSVQILAVPPVPGGFVGTMTLTVRVFSPELRIEDRQVVKLIVEGKGSAPLEVALTRSTLHIAPGNSFEIPLTLHNPNRTAATTRLGLEGLPQTWLVDGQMRSVSIAAQGEAHATFLGRLPKTVDSLSQTYPFQIEAVQAAAAPVQVHGSVTVVPAGYVDLELKSGEIDLAADAIPGAPDIEMATTDEADNLAPLPPEGIPYTLTLNNQSNVHHSMGFMLEPEAIGSWWRSQPQVPKDPIAMAISPEVVELKPGAIATLQLYFTGQRPWVGLARHRHLKLKPTDIHPDIEVRPQTVPLTLKLPPHIPSWLQGLVLLIAALLLLILPFRLRGAHRGAVNTVQFDGQANEVVSGSVDQSIRRWRVAGRRLRPINRLPRFDKAIRVLRYRPLNNNALAVGFENGEIRLWNLLSGNVQQFLSHAPDDRVFDLQFSPDARRLYSGHGSGTVLQWDLTQAEDTFAPSTLSPERTLQVGFAVQGLALVGDDQQALAIGGRYNRLLLWQLGTNTTQSLAYPDGGQTDYILQLATALQRPNRLATADNQGRITLWDLGRCLTTDAACALLDERGDAHGGAAIQAIALSDDSCYLATGGDDGSVKLWPLDPSGQLNEPQQLAQFNQPVKAIDVVRIKQRVLVVTGGQDHRVKLYDVTDSNDLCR
ncbi:MAG: WD40 repeat domain-containing protein [Cyanobacteria bacterium P01_A01_bin.123]